LQPKGETLPITQWVFERFCGSFGKDLAEFLGAAHWAHITCKYLGLVIRGISTTALRKMNHNNNNNTTQHLANFGRVFMGLKTLQSHCLTLTS
jgi:hypothetical protein